jgi:hypothetical protein
MKRLSIALGCVAALAATSASSAFALNGYTPISSQFAATSTNAQLVSAAGTWTCRNVSVSAKTAASVSTTAAITNEGFNHCEREGEPLIWTTDSGWSLKETGLGTTELTVGGATITLNTLGCTVTIKEGQKIAVAWENGIGELDPSTLTLNGAKLAEGGTCGYTEQRLTATFVVTDLTHPSEPIKQT